MKKLLAAIGIGLALALTCFAPGCSKSGEAVNPQVKASMEKGASLRDIKQRGPKPPDARLRPEGVKAPGGGPPAKGAQGGGQGQ